MNIKKIFIKVVSMIMCVIIISTLFMPIIVQATQVVNTAKKQVLNSIEDITKYVDESKYPGVKEKLIELKKENPNWKFTLYYTGLDWSTVIYNETEALHSRSLVQSKTGKWICEICGTKVYDYGGWMCASKEAVSYFMDIRNYLTENYIFQFEELSYNEEVYTIDGIEKVLNGTFMYNKNIREYYNNSEFEDITFAEAIMEAAKTSGVSPYFLASRIRQELGINGSNSIYGTYPEYEGYYNFYNIGANSGTDPIGNGLKYASNTTLGKYLLPWNDPVKAIKGGAIWIARNYIAVKQDTLYFQKFDVVSNGTKLYDHQYMQNIFAARNEGYTTYSTYKKLNLLDNNYNFIIPLYENMPTKNSAEPGTVSTTETVEEKKVENVTTVKETTEIKEEKVEQNVEKIKQNSNEVVEQAKEEIVKNKEQEVTKEKVYISGNNVYLRKNPTTSSAKLAILKINTNVNRLEKNVANANGLNWDKIELTNGTIGYVASKYVSSTTVEITSKQTAVLNGNNVYVRKNPTTTSSKLATLKKNTTVTVLEKNVKYSNGYYWTKVELSNGTFGYIASKYLSSTTTVQKQATQTAKLIGNNVYIRKNPTTSATKLATLKKNTAVIVLGKNVKYSNGYYWTKVKLSNGTIGYIASKYLG